MSQASASLSRGSATSRWLQLLVGIVCMVMIANLQYGWTLFVNPIDAKYHWGRTDIQVAFSLFVLTETWLVPIEGWFVDRFGPRIVVAVGGVLVAVAWVINSMAASLPALYLGAIVGGVGAGAVYGTCVGNALKWFADRRGLAAGLTAAGFGAGAAMTVIPIQYLIKTSGYESAFLWFGLGQGLIVLLLSSLLVAPRPGEAPAAVSRKLQQVAYDSTPLETLRTPLFWVLYVLFVMMAASGLIMAAQIAPIAKDFKIADVPVSILGIAGPTLVVAISIDNVLNGLARPFFGWVSDKVGRENTMFVVFSLGAVSMWGLSQFGHQPVYFVLFCALSFFTWGEIFSLFPATCTDAFGTKYATTNAGLLYTAKGTGSLLVPFASLLTAKTGSWYDVFVLAAILNLVAGVAALLVLKPMRRAHHSSLADAGHREATAGSAD
ncbi:MAG TPA: oxalate/formate MFS antiporter [Alphaproteobacteria bacterium]|nr:oxalate/formate MFS antiporter [Alphaproteobacteria bacterium]